MRSLHGLSAFTAYTYLILRGYMEHDCQLGNYRFLTMSQLRYLLGEDGGQGKTHTKIKVPATSKVQYSFKKLAERGLLNLDKYNPKDRAKLFIFFPLASPYALV